MNPDCSQSTSIDRYKVKNEIIKEIRFIPVMDGDYNAHFRIYNTLILLPLSAGITYILINRNMTETIPEIQDKVLLYESSNQGNMEV